MPLRLYVYLRSHPALAAPSVAGSFSLLFSSGGVQGRLFPKASALPTQKNT